MMMNKKYLIILFIFTCALLTISIVSAAENNTNNTITSSVDDTVISTTSATYKTLNEEINNASENSELILTKDYTYNADEDYCAALKYENYITINKTITINGNGHIINGSEAGIGFVIEEGVENVIIKNIRFVDCHNEKNKHRILDITGGAIIDNCTFHKCVGYDNNYGIIKVTGNNNIIQNCKFGDCLNAMIYPKLAEPLNGGVIYLNGEYNKIINCTFTTCWANYQFSRSNSYLIRGNCIYIGMSHNLIEKCNFNYNYFYKQGETRIVKYGDIYIHTGENNITQCNFYKGESSMYATSIFANRSTVNIDGCIFRYVKENGVYIGGDNSTLVNSQFISCSGHATVWIGANGIMKNCTFKDCTYNQINSWYGENGQFIEQDTPTEPDTNNTSNETENNNTTADSTEPPKNNTSTSSSAQNNTPSNTPVKTTPTSNTNKVVKKVTPKITAKKKTYKAKTRTKKYTVKLTVNKKPLKKARVTLKINGRTYTSKTNSKGVATFKLKLTKKGKYTATILFKATKKYNSKKIKTQIRIK